MERCDFFERPRPRRITACILALLMVPFFFTHAGADSNALSAAVLGRTYTLCGLRGMPLAFSADTLEQGMGLSKGSLVGIILTDLPDASKGGLTVDDAAATVYETIGREGIGQLLFTPKNGVTDVSFHFIPLVTNEGEKTATLCITLLDTANVAPELTARPIAAMEGVRVTGRFSISDETPNTVTLRLTKGCTKGDLHISGRTYTYEPYPDETGSDSFTCVPTDIYGESGSPVTFSIQIEKKPDGVSYADMADNPNAYAALKLAQLHLMVGERAGGSYLFEPSRTISAGEFLMLLLAIRGEGGSLPATVNTGLSNDTAIPMWLKPYVRQGIRDGILKGSVGGASFDADAAVTQAQAYTMAARAARLPDTELSDAIDNAALIPAWAVQSYADLCETGIVWDADGAQAKSALTRSEAAGLLWSTYQYCAAQKGASGS